MSMEIRHFSEVLRAAVAGDSVATEAILARYMPLINNRSIAVGKYDEDLRQYIIMRVIEQIPKFDPDKPE
jgi:DNA-directed RNA polymerase specialized sigma subunit